MLPLSQATPFNPRETQKDREMVCLLPYKDKIDAAFQSTVSICTDPKQDFLNLLTSHGFKKIGALQMDKIQRIQGIEDKGTKKSGWYAYSEIEDNQIDGHILGIASFGDWKTGLYEFWTSRAEHQMSNQERSHYHAVREEMREKQEQEQKIRHAEAAKEAYSIWFNSPQAATHPYLEAKGVKSAEGVKECTTGHYSGCLIVPIAVDGVITSLQYIYPNSDKRFLSGGNIKGGYFLIEGEKDTIYVTEGYSTGKSVNEATGKRVYLAFNAGNLYEVCSYAKTKYPGATIIIAGDDDTENKINVGRNKAEQAAQGLSLGCIFPQGFVDFNDMHHALGMNALKEYLQPKNVEIYEPEEKEKQSVYRPFGILGEISDYYHTTSGNRQSGFAVQTSLAICGLILGRCYKTSLENYTNLYLLNVAKSGTGKEHNKTVFEKIMHETKLGFLLAGDGYTSAGAVFSTLLNKPVHGTCIDELGRYLEAGRGLSGGNNHHREANTKLMEAIGRSHSIMRPPSYSTMTLKKEDAKDVNNRVVHNPCITLLSMTTPDTLFKTLDMGAIKDGFINRFIISFSDAQREIRVHKEPVDVPLRIIEWASTVRDRYGKTHIAGEPANPITINFSKEAMEEQVKFQQHCIDKANQLEKFGMSELPMRSNEMAMKLSLIHALSRDPHTDTIEGVDMAWSILYVKTCLEDTINRLKITISHSEYEGDKKEVLASLRELGKDGITWANMQKNPPYSRHKQKDLRDIMQSLKDADLAVEEPYVSPKGGRPTVKWRALK